MGWFANKRAPTKRAGANEHVAGANGFGAPYHQVFSWHPLPEAGAMQYSWDTLCLPKYSMIGNGPGNAREFQTIGSCVQPLHGVHLNVIGGPGVLTGQFVGAPLHDIVGAPSLPGPPDQSTPDQPVLNNYVGMTLNPGQYQLPG
jgi:hypothetical protein